MVKSWRSKNSLQFLAISLRLLNALNSEDRGLKVRFSLATIAFDRESAQMSQILSSQGKNAPSNPYPHYLVRLATSRLEAFLRSGTAFRSFAFKNAAFCYSAKFPRAKFWRNVSSTWARSVAKTWAKKCRQFSSFNFQQNWLQETSRKILGKFHEP